MIPGLVIIAGSDDKQVLLAADSFRRAEWDVFIWDARKGFSLTVPDEVAIPRETKLLVCIDNGRKTDRLISTCVRAAPGASVILISDSDRELPTNRSASFSIPDEEYDELASLISEVDTVESLFGKHLTFGRQL